MKRKLPVALLVAALLLLVLGVMRWTSVTLPRWYGGPSSAAEYGDMFGFANAIFSGLAFGGVIIAILLQSQELALQRRELELARDEARRSAGAQENVARLSAISELITHYRNLGVMYEKEAIATFPDMNQPGGRRIVVKDQEAFDKAQDAARKLERCFADLESIYAAVSEPRSKEDT
jgi:hypothetical protein